MHPVFDNEEFKHFTEYVDNVWKPATECAVIVTESATLYPTLKLWFDEHLNETISIGPFIDIKPYGGPFEMDRKAEDGSPMIEFLFLYEEIDKTKLEGKHLLLGRNDFVDLGGTGNSVQ